MSDTAIESAVSSVLLHIGFHKTGSTWLQRRVFARPENRFEMVPQSEVHADFVAQDPIGFPHSIEHKYMEKMEIARKHNTVLVLSHERLSGYPASGGYDQKLIADRLREVFPQAVVLIIIREQTDLLGSMYSAYVRNGGSLSMKRFFDPPEPHLRRMPAFRYSFYEFDVLASYYGSLFGPSNVVVLPFELFRIDQAAFLSKLAKTCRLPSLEAAETEILNRGNSWCFTQLLRRLNATCAISQLEPGAWFDCPKLWRFTRRHGWLIDAMCPSKLEKHMNARTKALIDARVADRYAQSNARLQRMTGLDLSNLGYRCAQLRS